MGQRITALRKMEGISQQELADRAGLTRQHIGRIEKGELVSVAYVTIQQIAEALGMKKESQPISLCNQATE